MPPSLRSPDFLPHDAARATLIGRLWQPGVGPVLVAVHEGGLHELSALAPTASDLLEADAAPSAAVRQAVQSGAAPRIAELAAVLANADESARDPGRPWLLAPCDLQAVKASGVTFIASLLERVIEE
ncbi:MAG: fumarylacetoacetate hydrolase, partial [Comamonadaceae bacterium]